MRKRPGKWLKFFLRLTRHPGTPERVGRGVAAGLFAAFIIPVGHMPLAFLLAIPVRGTRSAAVLSTWIINPLTLSVVYPVQCYLGSFIIGDLLSYPEIKQLIVAFLTHPGWNTFCDLGSELIVSFFAGGLLLGAAVAVIGYFSTTKMVRGYRARKMKRKESKMRCQKTEEC